MYCLRELEKKDLCIINKWHDNPEAIALLGASHCFVNLNIDEKWFDNYIINRGNVVCCTITDDTDECLGLVSLTGVDFWNRSAEFHIMIGDMENQNKGIGSFAINSMLHHAFYNMNLHRVTLSVLETSERARHVYEKIGFVYEGCKRKSYFKNGEYVNTLIYSILKDEYNKNFAVNFFHHILAMPE